MKDLRASELFGRMCGAASFVGISNFGTKSSKFPGMLSVVQHLPHIMEEMEKHLYVNIYSRGSDDKLYTFLRPDEEEVRVPRQYAELLDLDPDDIYDPGIVAERILKLAPGAEVTKDRLIDMWGVQRARQRKKRGKR